jgi:SAM-dependent methyltransferase
VGQLSDVWDANAAAWIAWARKPGHDSYWRFHRDLFLEIVPPPRGRTLDIGCGEGRFARDLAMLGHDVAGIDASSTMIAAAGEAAPDVGGALREAARVLEPRGRLCLAIVHPLSSAGAFSEREANAPFVIEGSYLGESVTDATFERDGLAMRFVSRHRPLQTYAEALAASGFLIECLREPPLPETGFNGEAGRRWQRIPIFLHLRAVKLAS